MTIGWEFWVQLVTVAICLAIGGKLGGLGLGAAGGLGTCILVLVFGMHPGSAPISVILIIIAVISCTSILQGSGGLDLLVRVAEKLLRKWPKAITFVAPFVCSIFVIFVGTAYVAFAVYPVIAEVAISAKIRPERPLAASVICAGIGVMASPMSAAMAALIGVMAAQDISFSKVLLVCIPTYFFGCFCAAMSVMWRGKELEEDPEFQRRVRLGLFQELAPSFSLSGKPDTDNAKQNRSAKLGVFIFALGILTAITIGSATELRPSWIINGKTELLAIPSLIQMVMLATGFLIIVACKVPSDKFASGSIFRAGLIGVVGVFGISWLTGTFFDCYKPLFVEYFSSIATSAPILFGLVCFAISGVIFSPSTSTAVLMPIGLSIGIPAPILIGMWPAFYGDFLIPGGAQIGCTGFDRTGTTKLGKYIFNHSYMRPGLVFVVSAVACGLFLQSIVF